MDYKTAWNLVGEVRERLAGKNGDEFAHDLGLFLKGGPMPAGVVWPKKSPEKRRKGREKKEFVISLADEEVPIAFIEARSKWRKLACDLGYTGPVLWAVKAGFTLKSHAPLAGPCYEKFSYLQDRELKNDEPTVDCLVFFIPRMVATKKNAEEQMLALAELREKYGLPVSHCASFGSAALVSGLILAHFKRTGERAPLNTDWVRTDTRHSGGDRLGLGDFGETGLGCDGDWDGSRDDNLGVFPLGVELGS
ncbi:MAG: hypothetical protein PHD72_03830 [Patescibacteria group bacterium]|nr:hypothetical protein [Patescibacteria group bacterium]